jgi:hypothetical protein
MAYPIFGVGFAVATPAGSNVTPGRLATFKDCKVSQTWDTVELYGTNQDPDDVASAKRKTVIDATYASYDAATYAALTGGAISTGSVIGIPDESGTIPGTPYKITVAQGATFALNAGVVDLSTGFPMTVVASGPAAGQYSFNGATGEYTFAAADTTHNVLISYGYTAAAVGKSVTQSAAQMGGATTFALDLFTKYNSKASGVRFGRVRLTKLDWDLGSEKHAEMKVQFVAMIDPTTNKISTTIFAG